MYSNVFPSREAFLSAHDSIPRVPGTSNLQIVSSPSYDREPFRVVFKDLRVLGETFADLFVNEVDLQLPQKNYPPEGLNVFAEWIVIRNANSYDFSADRFFGETNDSYNISVSGLCEPYHNPNGGLNDDTVVFNFANNTFNVDPDDPAGRAIFHGSNKISYGDIGIKTSHGLQKRLSITSTMDIREFATLEARMDICFLFVPSPKLINAANTNNAG